PLCTAAVGLTCPVPRWPPGFAWCTAAPCGAPPGWLELTSVISVIVGIRRAVMPATQTRRSRRAWPAVETTRDERRLKVIAARPFSGPLARLDRLGRNGQLFRPGQLRGVEGRDHRPVGQHLVR